jgi:hypothetical protein
MQQLDDLQQQQQQKQQQQTLEVYVIEHADVFVADPAHRRKQLMHHLSKVHIALHWTAV